MNHDQSCPLCKGELTARVISYTQEYHGRLFLVENVPARVCAQCSETVLDVEVAGRIYDLVRSGKPQGKRTLPVYDLQAAAT